MSMRDKLKESDMGLGYNEAMHGVQSAIAYAMEQPGHKSTQPKHMRVGIDMRASDHMALVSLLIDKGVFTYEEYEEYLRLAANQELRMHEVHLGGLVKFR